ncbi:hypothetical protein [Synechococcus phage S-B43]|jgi:hypothetical protein|nr:hypothetical protein [Synechococcus phage S-B43]
MNNLKILILTTDKVILTQIEEVATDLGEPDCKLIEPFELNEDGTLSPWLVDLTRQNTFMIHSDKILTIVEPNSKLIEKYEDLVK